jgi:hypothetical protein
MQSQVAVIEYIITSLRHTYYIYEVYLWFKGEAYNTNLLFVSLYIK